MTGKSHVAIGTASAVIAATVSGCTLETGTAVIVAGAATAKLPDVDLKIIRSRAATLGGLAVLIVLAAFAATWYVAVGLGLIFTFVLQLQHRQATHTLLACIGLIVAVTFALSLTDATRPYSLMVSLGIVAGYGMHLLADACTPRGVPLFAPFRGRDFHLLPRPLRVGYDSRAERAIVGGFALAAAIAVYSYVF